jgi:hypothetical protein
LRFRRFFIIWILAGSTDFGLYDNDGSEDVFPNHPDDLELDWFLQENFSKVLDIATKIKNAGNGFFKNKDFDKAVKKYQKACRYLKSLHPNWTHEIYLIEFVAFYSFRA